MRIFQNKIIVGGSCISLAALLSFVALPMMNRSRSDTTTVFRFADTVSAGTMIEEGMLTEHIIGSYGLPSSVVKEKDKIIGRYVNQTMTKDELILENMLSDYATNQRLDSILAEGKKLVTVTVTSLAAGMGSMLQNGDIVSVFNYADGVVSTAVNNLEIYCIVNDTGRNIEEEADDTEKLAAVITLIADDEQAKKLIQAEYAGKLHLVFEKRGMAA